MSDARSRPTNELYRTIYLIRRFEEEVVRLYPSDVIKSPVHLSLGQEAAVTAVCAALEENDVVFPTYRCHAAYLAQADVYGLLAAWGELFGKGEGGDVETASACCGGKGGSMHLCMTSMNVMGATAIVATNIPLAVGFAYKYRKTETATVAFFGDGAMEQGVVYEAMNFAALHSLPVLFICENNELAIDTPRSERQAAPILPKAQAMGITSHRCRDDEVRYVFDVVRKVRLQMVASPAPHFVEIPISRACPHVGVEQVEAVSETLQEASLRAEIGDDATHRIRVNIDVALRDTIGAAQALLDPAPPHLRTNVWSHPLTQMQ